MVTDDMLRQIRAVLEKGWSADTAYRSTEYTGTPKSYGQCYVTARIMHEIFGWDIMINKKPPNNHYWNRTPDGREVDFTSDQAGGNGFDPFLTGKLSKRKYKPCREVKNQRLNHYYERVCGELLKKLKVGEL